jgi:hypothetical protein
MKAPAANKSSPEANTKKLRNRMTVLTVLFYSSSRPCIHFVSCLSLTRHRPPTLKAGNFFRLTIRCTVRSDNCSTSAVSLRVSTRNGSSSFSIGRACGATPMPLRYRVARTASEEKRPLCLLNRHSDRVTKRYRVEHLVLWALNYRGWTEVAATAC